MKPYLGPVPSPAPGERSGSACGYIRLMPAFEESITPSRITESRDDLKGIYRYLGGGDGQEVIYIGKGSIRRRFQEEAARRQWNVSRIEYSALDDDQTAYEWEAWWIQRHREEHGDRPRYNSVDSHDRIET
ncbi:MAG: hypothetical protein OXH52_19340 [Gammaproteobacteria bacterium]|nr:hypothetical protein [Gammaproteobacteria bacterium]